MAAEGTLFSVASVVEDVLQQHGNRLRDLDLESRKAEEAGTFFRMQRLHFEFFINYFFLSIFLVISSFFFFSF